MYSGAAATRVIAVFTRFAAFAGMLSMALAMSAALVADSWPAASSVLSSATNWVPFAACVTSALVSTRTSLVLLGENKKLRMKLT